MTFRASLLPTLFCLLHTVGNSAGAQSPRADTQLLLEMADGACRYSGIFVPRSARLLEITDLNPFFDAPGPPQKVLKTSTGLLLLPDGTGRVYAAQPTDGRLDFVRIDSTRFMGYNFGAFPFVYRDTLFSYGGYGFWHYNGQLRVFDTKKHEWQLVPLDREVPIQVADPLGISCWLDETTGRLYVNGMSPHQPNTDSLHVLDLNQDSWTTLGKSEIPNAQVIFQVATPWGVFCKMAWNKQEYTLLDFRRNAVLRLKPGKSEKLHLAENFSAITYVCDSTLVIGSSPTPIRLSYADFEKTELRLYTPISRSVFSRFPWIWSLASTSLLGLFAWYAITRKTKKNNGHENGLGTLEDNRYFQEKEKELIQLVFHNSMTQTPTSIDEINRIIGVTVKSPDVQKKQRSDTILSINRKFTYLTKTQGPLLQKHRSDGDKRTFEYFMNPVDYQLIKPHL